MFARAKRTLTCLAVKLLDVRAEEGRLVLRPERGAVVALALNDAETAAGAVRSAMDLAG